LFRLANRNKLWPFKPRKNYPFRIHPKVFKSMLIFFFAWLFLSTQRFIGETYSMKTSTFAATFLLLTTSTLLHADVIYSLGAGSNNTSVIDPTWKLGQSFTNTSATGATQELKTYLSKQGTVGGSLIARIYDAGGASGSYVPQTSSLITSASIDASTIGAQGYYSFTNFSAHSLTSGNRYVFVLDFTSVTGLGGSNALNFFQGSGTGVGVTGQNAVTNTSGTWSPDNTYNYSAVVSVPEPGTFLLYSLSAVSAGAGVWWRKRRKNSLPAKT
jgi:hypothetical protein